MSQNDENSESPPQIYKETEKILQYKDEIEEKNLETKRRLEYEESFSEKLFQYQSDLNKSIAEEEAALSVANSFSSFIDNTRTELKEPLNQWSETYKTCCDTVNKLDSDWLIINDKFTYAETTIGTKMTNYKKKLEDLNRVLTRLTNKRKAKLPAIEDEENDLEKESIELRKQLKEADEELLKVDEGEDESDPEELQKELDELHSKLSELTEDFSRLAEEDELCRSANDELETNYGEAVFTDINTRALSLSLDQSSTKNEDVIPPPSDAKVVICGGGIMGASVAYHLGKLGWGSQTVLVEQNRVGGGTTWHSSGLIGAFKPSISQVNLTKSSIELYKQLEASGLSTGWKQCGSLNLARTRDRMVNFRRMKAQSVAWKIDCEILTPVQCKEKCPLINIDDIYGGLWIPGDGVGDPYEACISLVGEAKNMGVQVIENCALKKVTQTGGKVSSVETSLGPINCEYFVNCAGFWARGLGQMSEPYVKVPLHAVEHYYLHTKPIPGLDPMTPVVRDQDGYVYFRENKGRLLAGGFEPVAKPAFEDGRIPASPKERQLPEDWDHFHVLLEQLLHRVPSLGNAVLDRLCNGPEAFSPDCKWIVGEAPEIRNYLVAAGMKTVGISAAGGVGKATAELIVTGETDFDMYELELSRFLGLHNNRKFLRDRVKEVPGLHYGLNYPFSEFQTGRNLRMSPVYPKLREAGAVFGQVMGYERPTWFDPHQMRDHEDFDWSVPYRIAYTNTFGKPPWFEFVAKEYAACREGVGISDYSSFTKIDLWSKGNEVVDALQYVCSNDVDVPLGSIIHTGMQNKRGGYENDCSLARLSENHYMMIAPTIQQTRCKVWLQKHLPSSVAISDVTSMFTALCIIGPFTRTLLSELTDTDLDPKNFPFFTFKMLDIGLANGIRTMNLTHTGELGYVMYIPNEFALHVYSSLINAGEKYDITHAGHYATRALRVEKFYAFWGQDLDTTTTPLECGRVWRVKFDKKVDFIGRDALLKQREEGVKRMYIQLLLEDHDSETDLWPWGGEPIYRDGKQVGICTTTGYGFTFKKQVCLGFVEDINEKGEKQKVTHDFITSGHFEVDVGGIRYHAKANIHSPILPSKYPDKERDVYRATRGKSEEQRDANQIVKAI